MKCLLIDKSEYESYIELPDGRIVSIPTYSTNSCSIGGFINMPENKSTELPKNTSSHNKKPFDFL